MKTKFIVEMEHDDESTREAMRSWVHKSLIKCAYAGQLTVTLAEPLQVRDTMPADGGWIEWKGGECPVSPEVRVLVKFFDGTDDKEGLAADRWYWGRKFVSPGSCIVAYKVLP